MINLPPEHSTCLCIYQNQKQISPTCPFHDSATYPLSDSIYPINLISTNLTFQQHNKLWNISLRLPLHIHTPTVHVGTISADYVNGYEFMNAVDVIDLLRSLANTPLDVPSFRNLQPIIQNRVQDARTSGPGSMSTWNLAHYDTIGFDQAGARVGRPTEPPPPPLGDRPLGRDSLLGNYNVWGFETASFSGCDVVHVD